MKTPSVVVGATLAGSVAFAAGQQSVRTLSNVFQDGHQTAAMRVEIPNAQIAQWTCCEPTEDAHWFAPVPHLVDCGSTDDNPCFEPLKSRIWAEADVNGDGVTDHFRPLPGGQGLGGYVVFQGTPSNDALSMAVVLESTHQEAPRVRLTRVRLFASNFDINSWCAANLPAHDGGFLRLDVAVNGFGGWRDMDEDGDLDLLVAAWTASGVKAQFWLENIGYRRPSPPVAADLNGDGRVDGADLGMLLIAWEPSP